MIIQKPEAIYTNEDSTGEKTTNRRAIEQTERRLPAPDGLF